ncbi:hypothetical protein QR680_017718 [Steinernema hermaphroditum]|uniref:Peptidase M12B domain-containing protein n=1 Tax=Steinernema hermaphroditum TaxID=289476 RepID=A0AA39HHM0_9BILA|nr:hypothetical protein QR680_017718 [Steinernema hermaphroditum]
MLNHVIVFALLAATTIAFSDAFQGGHEVMSTHVDHVHIPHRSHRQRRAEPAIWGEPAPDYSMAKLDGTVTLLRALIFVEQKIVDFYNRDMNRVRREILRMVRESNDYFYQINMRISVVDIQRTTENMTLYSFEEFRLSRLGELPEHDFAALIAFRYAGGLAFVGGMCTTKAVLYCGFYPHNPEAMGSIFFHEVAHLIGVPHANKNDSLRVENCDCTPEYLASVKPSVGCLKIPGYDHDCTAQMMANLVPRNRCLKRFGDFDLSTLPASSFEHAVCGNGIVETGEDCDCGIEAHCLNPNCRARSCRHVVPIWAVTLVAFFCALCAVAVFMFYKKYIEPSSLGKLKPLKSIGQLKNSLVSMRSRVNTAENLQDSLSRHKIDPESIVVLIPTEDKKPNPRANLPRRGTLRPSQPPPPPPVARSNTLPSTKLGPPPPRPSNGPKPKLVVNPLDNLPNSELYEIPKHVRLRPSAVAEEPLGHESVTLSQKFEDFSESESEAPSPLAPRKERGSCFEALRGRRNSSSADSASEASDLRTQSTDCASNSPSDELFPQFFQSDDIEADESPLVAFLEIGVDDVLRVFATVFAFFGRRNALNRLSVGPYRRASGASGLTLPRKLPMRSSLLLLLAALLVADSFAADLVHVQALWRHGDRAPLGTYANDPNPESAWPVPFGELTNDGLEQHYQQGLKLKRTYIDRIGFCNATFHVRDINVRSTDVDRTLMSAYANLAAFYSGSKSTHPAAKNWPTNWSPVPIHTVDRSTDHLLNANPDCIRMDELEAEQVLHKKFAEFMLEQLPLLEELSKKSGTKITNFKGIRNFWDCIKIEKIHNMTIPSWITDELFAKVEKVIDQGEDYLAGSAGFGKPENTELIMLKGGQLLKEMIDNFQSAKAGSRSPRYHAYSAHDTTVTAFLRALGAKEGVLGLKQPDFAALVVLELWVINQNDFYTFTHAISGCPQQDYCPLDAFVKRSQQYIPKDIQAQCDKIIG